ncbi:MAG: hypothetical protein N3B21_08340 [Clostridia bacterium]|nr:hypothetical protein [Clostridia bacterium]
MSDCILKIIPNAPMFVPSLQAINSLREIEIDIFSHADGVEHKIYEHIEFIDQGSNFERIICPICSSEISMDWWQDSMDRAYTSMFVCLDIETPCCKKACNLNSLKYEESAGFSKIAIEVLNPKENIKKNEFYLVEKMLGCSLRKIWAYY